MLKRLTSLLLVMAMILSLLQVSALAAESEYTISEPEGIELLRNESGEETVPASESTLGEKHMFSSVDALAFGDMSSAYIPNNPVSFQQPVNEQLEGKTITKVGIPVLTLSDYTQDCKTEIHLVSAENAAVFATYPLVIPANTYASNTVNAWVWFDLHIAVGEGEMLAFGALDDTLSFGYANVNDQAKPGIGEAISERGGCITHVTRTPAKLNHALLFDLIYEEGAGENPLAGKYMSVLGASTSTFDGFSDGTAYNSTISGNAQYYPKTFLAHVYDTWWMKTIRDLDLKLCVNNSWSGACVTTKGGVAAAGCMDRVTQLHNDKLGIDPDLVVLIIGGNDALQGVEIGAYSDVSDIYDGADYVGDCSLFGQAYATMVHKAQTRYPDAEIYVCSMLHWKDGMEPYNAMIQKIADEFGVSYVDLYNDTDISPETKGTYLHTDGIHPTEQGFEEMAQCMAAALQASAHVHAYEAAVTAPTCTEQGYTTYTCNCGDSYADSYAAALGHTYSGLYCDTCKQPHPHLSGHLQQLPEDICAGTNLWTTLVPENAYFASNGTGWLDLFTSVTFPVKAGERIISNAYGKAGTNGHSGHNGIQVNFFKADGSVTVLTAAEVYAEYAKTGWITVPEGTIAVNTGQWNTEVAGEIYLPDRAHTSENSICTYCGQKDFSKQTYVAFGDSITYGVDGNYKGGEQGRNMPNPYPKLVGQRLGFGTVSNQGVSGGTLCADSGRTNMTEKILNFHGQADVISVMLGVNDYAVCSPMGEIDSTDNKTIYGSLNLICQHLTENYPDAFVFFMTPFQFRGGTNDRGQGYNLPDVAEAIKTVAAKYQYPVLDMYTYGKFEEEFNDASLAYQDGIHPSQQHHAQYTAPMVAEFIAKNDTEPEDDSQSGQPDANGRIIYSQQALTKGFCTVSGIPAASGVHSYFTMDAAGIETITITPPDAPAWNTLNIYYIVIVEEDGTVSCYGKLDKQEPTVIELGGKIKGTVYFNAFYDDHPQYVYVKEAVVVAHEHAYETVVTEPTCTEQGYTTYTCAACGDSYKADYVEPMWHTYNNGQCSMCGDEMLRFSLEDFVQYQGGVNSTDGTLNTTFTNNWYADIRIPEGAEQVRFLIFKTGGDWGSAFLNGNTYISGICDKTTGGYWTTIDVPEDATTFRYGYLYESIAANNGYPAFSYLEFVGEDLTVQEDSGFMARPATGCHSFSVKVNIAPAQGNPAGYAEGTDYGYIQLPTSYTSYGDPTRLIIVCHGAGAELSTYQSDAWKTTNYSFWTDLGYAVMDMYASPTELTGNTSELHYGSPVVVDCYKEGYDYVMEHFNLKQDGVFLIGSSMGGLSSFQIAQSGKVPVIAQVGYCPVIDLFKQAYVNPWATASYQRSRIAQYFGFTGTAPSFTDSKYPSAAEIEYYKSNFDQTIPYSPILSNVVSGDLEKIFAVIPSSATAMSAEEEALYQQLAATHPNPLMIFHNTDDSTVAYRYSKYFVDMVNRSGQEAVLRTFTSGAHNAWANGNDHTVQGLNGNITIKDSQYEAYLFFKEYEEHTAHIGWVDPAVAPTCTESGLTQGSHCAVCGEILTAQQSIPAKGHSYVNGVCTGCGEAEVLQGSIRLRSAALNLLDKVCIIYKTSDDLIATKSEDVAERGVLLYDSAEKAASKDPALAYETVTLEYNPDEARYVGQTEGIDARDMDRSQFAVAYLKMRDGSYIFGTKEGNDQVQEYSPLIYCRNKADDPVVGKLCRAMMHYGAAAQVLQYGMTDGLMNEGFEAVPYDAGVLGEEVFSADTSVIDGMRLRSVTMDLQGAISYIIKYEMTEEAAGKSLYAEYALLGRTGSVELVYHADEGRWWATISGVPAKDLGAELTVTPYYLDEQGAKVYGGQLVYSGNEYVRRALDKAESPESLKSLAKAMAMYVHYADKYGN